MNATQALAAIKPAAKALVAGAGTFAAAVATGYTDGTMTTGEWWTATAGALAVLGGTYRIPNTTRRN